VKRKDVVVADSSSRNSIGKMLSGLGWPLIIGLAACSMFYVLIIQGPLNTPSMHRYFATHPVAYAIVAMFFVGAAALTLKLADVVSQTRGLKTFHLRPPADFHDTDAAAAHLLGEMSSKPSSVQDSYLANRLREAVEFVIRKGSGAGLDDELKYLSDLDAARQQDSYGLVRIIIWATPMLGFLGTVIGITQALGDLDPQELANSIQTAMDGLLSGLYIAFDTTAVALSLSIVLMFVQFLVDRVEMSLLGSVDERATQELLGKFNDSGFRSDPHLIAVDRMSVAVAKTTEQLMHQQTALWRETIEDSNQQWSNMVETSGEVMRTALSNSLETSLANHADRLAKIGREADEQVRTRWEQWQTALSDNARLLHSQQQEMVRQGEIMADVINATGDIVKLEKALNENLHLLAGSKNFEDTVMSLSAAIHLLNARLGHTSDLGQKVELGKSDIQDRAA
jgi:biopolymer transport protein ExbB/TolQ